MRHKVNNEVREHPYLFMDIQLLPENDREQQAIENARNMEASHEDNDIIERYLVFKMKAVEMNWKQDNRVILKCSLV